MLFNIFWEDYPSLSIILAHMCSPTPMHYCTSQPHPYALLHKPAPPLCTFARASPTPMHYCASQPHPYALLCKPAPPLCTIAQASPTPNCCTSQPHPYALLHKPAPPLYAVFRNPAPPLCTTAQSSPTPMLYCTSQLAPMQIIELEGAKVAAGGELGAK